MLQARIFSYADAHRYRLGREARRFVERTASPAVFAARLASAFRTLARR
jgi:catalase